MGENTLTTKEKAEIEEEISKTYLLQEKITQRAKKIMKTVLYILPLVIFAFLLCCAKLGFVQNITLVYWYDTINGPQMIVMSLITLALMLCALTIMTLSLVNHTNGKKTIKKLDELRDRFNGRIVDQEKEREIQIEKLKKQNEKISSICMFFAILWVICMIFDGTYGIKIENENIFIIRLAEICQSKILIWVILIPAGILASLYLIFDRKIMKLEKEQAKNAPPAKMTGSDIQG